MRLSESQFLKEIRESRRPMVSVMTMAMVMVMLVAMVMVTGSQACHCVCRRILISAWLDKLSAGGTMPAHTGVSPNHSAINTLFLPSRMSSTLTQRLKERRGGDRIDTYIQRRTSTDTQLKPHIYAESITTMFVDLLVLARLRFGCDCSLP